MLPWKAGNLLVHYVLQKGLEDTTFIKMIRTALVTGSQHHGEAWCGCPSEARAIKGHAVIELDSLIESGMIES